MCTFESVGQPIVESKKHLTSTTTTWMREKIKETGISLSLAFLLSPEHFLFALCEYKLTDSRYVQSPQKEYKKNSKTKSTRKGSILNDFNPTETICGVSLWSFLFLAPKSLRHLQRKRAFWLNVEIDIYFPMPPLLRSYPYKLTPSSAGFLLFLFKWKKGIFKPL